MASARKLTSTRSASRSTPRRACWTCRLRINRKMRFDIITIFPEIFRGVFEFGIIRRAAEAGLVEMAIHDLREYTYDRHRQVDDRPFGGGAGMVMKPEPLFRAVEAITHGAAGPSVVL